MSLGIQLLAASVLVGLTTLVHGIGIVGMTKWLRLEQERLIRMRTGPKAYLLLSAVALALFMLHAGEITIFALFYLLVGALADLEQAVFHSASAYSTLGHGSEDFPHRWRVVSALEGVTGFLMLGWSTAVFITDMNQLLRGR